MSKWAIAKRESTVVRNVGNRKFGKYGDVLEYKAFRRFANRDQAREYKASLKNPNNYLLINTLDNTVNR